MVKRFFAIWVLLLPLMTLSAQTLRTEVSVRERAVFVGEPARVSVQVFTSTWFTKGVDPGNIQVPGAFTLYFRSVSTSKNIDGKMMAGVEMIFNVFPYNDMDVTIPALTIQVETPPEGDYRGKKRTVHTYPRKIKVKAIPPKMDVHQWFVTDNLTFNQSWNPSPNSIKVGEVLQRNISRRAQGTVSEFIPSLDLDTISGVSIYTNRAEKENHKTRTSIYCTQTDKVQYLFEKEGEIIIPDKEFIWWDARRKQLMKRTLKGRTILVLPNPDLAMLQSVRDSLDSMRQAELNNTPIDEVTLSILGIEWYWFLAALAGLLSFLAILIRAIVAFLKKRKAKRKAYEKSEAYYFKQLLKTMNHGYKYQVSKFLYRWIDNLTLEEPTLQILYRKYGNGYKVPSKPGNIIAKDLKAIRNNYLKSQKSPKDKPSNDWIN